MIYPVEENILGKQIVLVLNRLDGEEMTNFPVNYPHMRNHRKGRIFYGYLPVSLPRNWHRTFGLVSLLFGLFRLSSMENRQLSDFENFKGNYQFGFSDSFLGIFEG